MCLYDYFHISCGFDLLKYFCIFNVSNFTIVSLQSVIGVVRPREWVICPQMFYEQVHISNSFFSDLHKQNSFFFILVNIRVHVALAAVYFSGRGLFCSHVNYWANNHRQSPGKFSQHFALVRTRTRNHRGSTPKPCPRSHKSTPGLRGRGSQKYLHLDC